jgi:YD repeat-containing protein
VATTCGRAVLWGDPARTAHLILTEGIETAAVALALAAEIEAGEIAVAAAISANGVEAFQPYAATARVTIAADRDEAAKNNGKPGSRRGEQAAHSFCLKQRINIVVALPGAAGETVDWLDVLARDGAGAVREGILSASPFVPPETELGAGGEAEEDAEQWPFRLTWNGVEKRVERVDRDIGVTVEWTWFCSLLEVPAETRSSEGEEWGRLLRVTDRDGRVKEWGMPMSMLAGDGTAYRERLLSLGLIMAPGKFARDALHEYISTARPDTKARCVTRVGWHSRAFILSNQTVES